MVSREQAVWAFIAALLAEGVSEDQIERAVSRVADFPLGHDMTQLSARPAADLDGVRTFMYEQAERLGATGG